MSRQRPRDCWVIVHTRASPDDVMGLKEELGYILEGLGLCAHDAMVTFTPPEAWEHMFLNWR